MCPPNRGKANKIDEKIGSNEFFEERANLLETPGLEKRVIWDQGLDLYLHKIQIDLVPFVNLCWYASPNEAKYISMALQQWIAEKSNDPHPKSSWRYVPSFFLVYISGISAVANDNWRYLGATLLTNPFRHEHDPNTIVYSFDLIAENFIYYYEQFDAWNSEKYPIGKYMQKALQPIFHFFLPLASNFQEAFDIFEFIVSLHHLDIRFDTQLFNPTLLRYANHTDYGDRSSDTILAFLRNGARQGNNWNLLKEGLFRGSSERFAQVLEAYQEKLSGARNRFGLPLRFPDYLATYKAALSK